MSDECNDTQGGTGLVVYPVRASKNYVPGRPIYKRKADTIFVAVYGIAFALMLIYIWVFREGFSPPEATWLWSALYVVWIIRCTYEFLSGINISIKFDENIGIRCRNFWRKTHDISYERIQQYGLETFWDIPHLVTYVDGKKYRFNASRLEGFFYLWEQVKEHVGPEKEHNKVWVEIKKRRKQHSVT